MACVSVFRRRPCLDEARKLQCLDTLATEEPLKAVEHLVDYGEVGAKAPLPLLAL
jgi:hypothetical protein